MKSKFIIYFLVIVVLVLTILFISFPESRRMIPGLYCATLSGTESYAWGGDAKRCINGGCKVVKTKEFDIPDTFDASGYKFICVGTGW
jgi:hypothetical protein